jgi:L-asparagine oxygenase
MSKDFRYTDIRAAGILLSAADSREMEQAALRIAKEYEGYSLHSTDLLHAVELEAAVLPPALRKMLIAFRDDGNSSGCLLLQGLPIGQVPATPDRTENEPHWSAIPVPTISQLMAMSVLGRSISYSDEKDGKLVQDVSPRRGAETRQENTGSALLELHTEDGFHPSPPHFLSLMCLRADHARAAATVSGGIGDALRDLDPQTVAALRRPEFRIRFSMSFVRDESAEVLAPPMPVLSGAAQCPDLRADFHATIATTPRAREAFSRLGEAILRSLKGVVLRPGEMIIIDNRRAVHGRSEFAPKYDGEDRWLRRSFAIADLRPIAGSLGPGRRHQPVVPGLLNYAQLDS